MHKHSFYIPAFIQSISFVCIALWWIFFISTRLGTIRFVQQLSHSFSPSTLSQEAVSQATQRVIEYISKEAPTTQSDIFFTQNEVSHIRDVSYLYKGTRVTIGVLALCAWAILLGTLLRQKYFSKNVFITARTLMMIFTFFLLISQFFFSDSFTIFHTLFFPQGNWEFPASATLIQLFPEAFWKLMTTWIFAEVVLFALLFHVLALYSHDDE